MLIKLLEETDNELDRLTLGDVRIRATGKLKTVHKAITAAGDIPRQPKLRAATWTQRTRGAAAKKKKKKKKKTTQGKRAATKKKDVAFEIP